MKYYILVFSGLLIISVNLFFFSCNRTCDNSIDEKSDSLIMGNNEKKVKHKKYYKIPLSIDLLNYIKDHNKNYNPELLNSVSNSDKYFNEDKKQINFGVYVTDLGYTSIFKQNQRSIEYFNVLKRMAEDLNITEGYGESLLKRIDRNINNSDSLKYIAEESYWDAFLGLEEKGKKKVLVNIIFGSWLESIYISSHTFTEKDKDMLMLLVGQSMVIENIKNYIMMEPYNEADYSNVMEDLKQIYLLLNRYSENIESIGSNDYEKIKTVISNIRNKYIKN